MSALKRPPAPLPSAPAGEPGSLVDRERRRGRGSLSNATGRYEPQARVAFDDGWQGLEDLPAFKTTVTADSSTAASIALRGRRTPIWACRRGWILNPSFS